MRAAEQDINLERYLVSFSKGSRQCLGINQVYAEAALGIARVVRAFELSAEDGLADGDEDGDGGEDGEADLVMGRIRRMGYRTPGLVSIDIRVVERLGVCKVFDGLAW